MHAFLASSMTRAVVRGEVGWGEPSFSSCLVEWLGGGRDGFLVGLGEDCRGGEVGGSWRSWRGGRWVGKEERGVGGREGKRREGERGGCGGKEMHSSRENETGPYLPILNWNLLYVPPQPRIQGPPARHLYHLAKNPGPACQASLSH